jgi:hypothetical protein
MLMLSRPLNSSLSFMKKHELRVNNKNGFVLSLFASFVPLGGLILLIYILVKTKLDLGEYTFLIYLIYPACLVFLVLALRSVIFALCGKHTVAYDEKKLIILNTAPGIKSKKVFLWDEIKRIGIFKKSQNSRGLNSAIGVETSSKYIFGHLLAEDQKESLAIELFSYHKERRGR